MARIIEDGALNRFSPCACWGLHAIGSGVAQHEGRYTSDHLKTDRRRNTELTGYLGVTVSSAYHDEISM